MKILSLDGGGVRGLLSAHIVDRLTLACGELPIDLYAGTSTGGLLASLLATGHTPRQCVDIYEKACPKIFAKPRTNVLTRMYSVTAKYDTQTRLNEIRKITGFRKFKDLNELLMITAFRVDGKPPPNDESSFFPSGRWRPCIFTNIPQGQGTVKPDLELHLFDACMRTSAAPTMFPFYEGYTDGGVFAQNPSLIAVARVLSTNTHMSRSDISVLSIGCGVRPNKIPLEEGNEDWGLHQWKGYLLPLMFDSQTQTTTLLSNYLLGEGFHRINPWLEEECLLDDFSKLDYLKEMAYSVDLKPSVEWIFKNMKHQ